MNRKVDRYRPAWKSPATMHWDRNNARHDGLTALFEVQARYDDSLPSGIPAGAVCGTCAMLMNRYPVGALVPGSNRRRREPCSPFPITPCRS